MSTQLRAFARSGRNDAACRQTARKASSGDVLGEALVAQDAQRQAVGDASEATRRHCRVVVATRDTREQRLVGHVDRSYVALAARDGAER